MNRRMVPWIIVVLALACTNRRASEINGVTQDSSGRRVVAWIDPMYAQGPPHLYKSNHPGTAPDCGMKLIPQYAGEKDDVVTNGVRIAPPQQQLIGVRYATVELRNLSRRVRTVGRVVADERRVAQVHSKFEGVIETLHVNFTGQSVRRGEPLLAIYSPDLLATENELILAERNHTDLGRSLADAARARLRLWDMSAAEIDRVAKSGTPIRAVTLRSPASGVVTVKNALAGARVTPADTLYEISDLSRVWVLADVYQSELPYVRVGSSARVTAGGSTVEGRVTFIGAVIGAQTRTATARIELDNSAGRLKPDMFAEVVLAEPVGNVLAVPDSAVMNTGTRSVVFLARDGGVFEPRDVTTGIRSEGFYEIRSGLTAGQRVVSDANFLVDSEARLRGQKAEGRGQKGEE